MSVCRRYGGPPADVCCPSCCPCCNIERLRWRGSVASGDESREAIAQRVTNGKRAMFCPGSRCCREERSLVPTWDILCRACFGVDRPPIEPNRTKWNQTELHRAHPLLLLATVRAPSAAPSRTRAQAGEGSAVQAWAQGEVRRDSNNSGRLCEVCTSSRSLMSSCVVHQASGGVCWMHGF